MKYKINSLLIVACISLAGLVACSEERRPATEQEQIVANAWLKCTKQEKWEKVYKDIGTIGTRLVIREECGAEPPYVEDD